MKLNNENLKGFMNKKWLRTAIIFLLVLVVGSVFVFMFANNNSAKRYEESTGEKTETVNTMDLLLKLFLSMIIIVGLIYLTVYIMRFINKKRNSSINLSQNQKEIIKVIHTKNLSPNKAVHILKISEKVLVVGATDHQMNLITELEPKDLKKFNTNEEDNKKDSNFKNIFSNYLRGIKR